MAYYPLLDAIDVTSMNGGRHGRGSYHYPENTPSRMCQAIDLRTRDMAPTAVRQWFARCVAVLAPMGYDLVLHDGTEKGIAPHLHIEYQPKYNEPDILKGVKI